MAVGNFEKCHAVTGGWEGGWSNHPADPGGATMYGITLAKYREHYPNATAAQLKVISRQTALAIYKSDFWNTIGAERLAAGVDLAAYDASVNSGPGKARKWLLASIGGSDVQTVKNICAKRLGFAQGLKTWKTFGKGWARRIADIEAKGVAWAMTAATNPNVVKKSLEREANEAGKSAKTQTTTGVGAGGGAVAVPQVEGHTGALIFVGACLAIVAAILIYRAYVNRTRANAYTTEASSI